MPTKGPFGSPIPKRFVQKWTTPLIPGLQDDDALDSDDATIKSGNNVSPVEMIPVEVPPLRERSFAESMSSLEAEMIAFWLDAEQSKSSIDDSSTSSKNTPSKPVFRAGSPSAKKMEKSDSSNKVPPKLYNDLFAPYSIYEAPSPDSAASFSPIMTTTRDPSKKPSRPVLADISEKMEIAHIPDSWKILYLNRPSQDDDEETRLEWLKQVSSHFRQESEDPKTSYDDSTLGSSKLSLLSPVVHFHEESENPKTPFDLALESSKKGSHSPIAHSSTDRKESFDLTLESSKKSMFSPMSRSRHESTGPKAPFDLTLQSVAKSTFSPISMPSAIQTGPRRHNRFDPNGGVRSILKTPGSALTGGSGTGSRENLGVRFDHPHTTFKKRPTPVTVHKQTTPTTWPQPSAPRGNMADYSFHDALLTRKKNHMGFIPYQTPESKSTDSSSASSHPSNQTNQTSGEKKTPTMIYSGKENHLDVFSTGTKSTGTKSTEQAKSVNSFPKRKPLQNKLVDVKRSASERNVLNGMI